MRIGLLLFIVILSGFSLSQDRKNIDLLDNWQNPSLLSNSSNVKYNDCWGYTSNGVEYAIAGSTEGTHYFRITPQYKFEEIDFVAGKFVSMSVVHRDIKVYQNYAYAVCDEGESSLQIIDLSYLPDSVHVVAENDTTFTRVHNIFIDEDNALLYACSITPTTNGTMSSLISMQVFSLVNPELPVLVYTGPNDIPEVHDVYVRDNIAYLNCGFDGLRVFDFNNPASPVFLQNITVYQEQGYNHQGWLSPDGKTYVFGDETGSKKLKKCTIDSNHEVQIKSYFGTNSEDNSVPHNIVITNEFAFVAYYNEGLRVYDIRPRVPVEIAHYDTYPVESFFNMNGAWGMYADYPSGNLLVSDRHYGLFLFDFNRSVFSTPLLDHTNLFPSPVEKGGEITIRMKDIIGDFTIDIYDLNGKVISKEPIVLNASYAIIKAPKSAGIYSAVISYYDSQGELVRINKRIMVN
jgi:choice-of-anchor B domain-containing protein